MNSLINGPSFGQAAHCETILRSLTGWFGIESSLVQYVRDADVLPTFTCHHGDRVVGFLTIKKHDPFSAETYIVGVLPEWHRRGIGTALLGRAEEWLRNEGVEFLQVKTLGVARPDPGYEKTRKFYAAVGFPPLEEFPTL